MAVPPSACSGRDVGGRAHHLAGLGERHALGGAGDAEVGDLDPAVGGDEQVGGLDVAVHDPGGVGDAEGVGGLGEQVAGHVGVERGARVAAARRAAGPRRAPSRGRGAASPSRRRASSRRSRRPRRCRGGAARRRAGPRSRSAGGRAASSAYSVLSTFTATGAVEHGVARRPDLAHPAGGDARLQDVAAGLVDVAAGRQRGHGLITASMIALAIGPPRTPPPISSGEVSLDCTSTATATLGSSAGAKETNQA